MATEDHRNNAGAVASTTPMLPLAPTLAKKTCSSQDNAHELGNQEQYLLSCGSTREHTIEEHASCYLKT